MGSDISNDTMMGSGGRPTASDVRFKNIDKGIAKIENEQISQREAIITCKLEIVKLKTRNIVMGRVGGGAFAIVLVLLGGLAAKIFGG